MEIWPDGPVDLDGGGGRVVEGSHPTHPNVIEAEFRQCREEKSPLYHVEGFLEV